MNFKLAEGVTFSETFEGIHLKWIFSCKANSSADDQSDPVLVHDKRSGRSRSHHQENSCFSLIFDREHKKKVCTDYLPYVVEASKEVVREEKHLKLFDGNSEYYGMPGGSSSKQSVNMVHPFKFENLAMDLELKKAIMDDLDRFVRRKEFYKRVGKPWKRGYLLYGPPGTGKSSLIAAMANYLKFVIYDLQLRRMQDSSLRQLLRVIPSKTIIVIEDIDCTGELPRRELYHTMYQGYEDSLKKAIKKPEMSLAALLNFADGLWSCCGDERLIIFTTNHKERLEPALLQPGRMDMHIHMSYLTMEGFKVLAYNYLLVTGNHPLFGEIKGLLEVVNATPAEVAEELMRSEDVDASLQGVVELLKRKKIEAEDAASLRPQAETEEITEKMENGNVLPTN
ncbi:AAA-ATPase At5g17760-like [Chenopodium quinoa]|nr:AAA-ATPase At5g17760-like [Chenopodium quinoa]